jgi:hypothetical protein
MPRRSFIAIPGWFAELLALAYLDERRGSG